ncbi:MAG: hypothetical protein PUA94_05725 [Bacteroidales bacterium]|nr:hypothetical protein [Bacteroidales bacterium]
MKKTRILLAAFAVMLAALILPQQAQAFGRGEKSLGVVGGYATYNNGGYMNMNFQWEFATHFRLAPEIGYVFKNDGLSAFEASIDMQFPFRLIKGFGVYPLIGVTLNSWHHYPSKSNATRFGGDFGAGFDIYLLSYLKLSIQGKYSLMNDTSGGFIGMGISYVFK